MVLKGFIFESLVPCRSYPGPPRKAYYVGITLDLLFQSQNLARVIRQEYIPSMHWKKKIVTALGG